jgi:general secretion pathway protein G
MGDLQRQPARLLAAGPRRERRLLGEESGLTLIELLVVMVILGLFSSIVYQTFFPKVDQAKIQTAKTQIDVFKLALDSYRLDYGTYPAGLEVLLEKGDKGGPYIQKKLIPKDPWGNDYTYQAPSGDEEPKVCSNGDGKGEPICSDDSR